MCYLRDHTSRTAMSFVDARFNVADVGTKFPGNADLWTELVGTNRFTVGLMGRKQSREYARAIQERQDNRPE